MRPTRDEIGIAIARIVALRGTCLRRQVGCVLANARGHVLATGYNGRAAGLPHCDEADFGACPSCGALFDAESKKSNVCRSCLHAHRGRDAAYPHACAGVLDARGRRRRPRSGTALDACEAIHAEQNALLQCRDVFSIETCYVTVSPCVTCVKLLMNTACRRIVFAAPYAHDDASRTLWGPREWIHVAMQEQKHAALQKSHHGR